MNIIERIRALIEQRRDVPVRHKRIVVRRATDLEDDAPPWWLRIHSRPEGSLAKRRPVPIVKCPNGHRTAVPFGLVHQVDDDGRVNPRIGCPAPGCGWAALVQLDGWEPA